MNKDKVSIKRYTETHFDTVIKRTDFFWKGINPESVGRYIHQLKTEKKSVECAFDVIDSPFNLNRDFLKGIIRAFDNEIELAEFYLELYKAKKNKNFDRWVFITEEERNKGVEDSWREKSGDCWQRSNGRVKAVIEIKKNEVSIKVSLSIENDSKMTFIEKTKDVDSSNLRNEDSIKNKIEEYKIVGERILNQTVYPTYCYEKRQFDALKNLLQIGGVG